MTSSKDPSLLIQPIELGSTTVTQLLNARTNVTKEILGYLEQECDAILECRHCKSLFRSLINFISHKRVYCRNVYRDPAVVRREGIVNQIGGRVGPVTVVPTAAHGEGSSLLTKSNSRQTENARRSIAPNKRSRPVRKTIPSGLVRLTELDPALSFSSIEGVTCAVSQTVAGGADDSGRSSVMTDVSSKAEHIMTIQPKDGYPNMNLRQRNSAASNKVRQAFGNSTDVEADVVEDVSRHKESVTSATKNVINSKTGLFETLSNRADCDVAQTKCLLCNSTFASIKTLNFHMLNKHSKQRKHYPCIYCKNVFTQFWGVTRHLKHAHGLTGDNLDKIREQIRARVYTDSSSVAQVEGNLPAAAVDTKPGAKNDSIPVTILRSNLETTSEKEGEKNGVRINNDDTADSGESKATKPNLHCNICSKQFLSAQSRSLHMIACYKKAGLDPPLSRRRLAAMQAKTPKPMLFVCKTCNRAFSSRHNMVQHGSACNRRNKVAGGGTAKAAVSPTAAKTRNHREQNKVGNNKMEVSSTEGVKSDVIDEKQTNEYVLDEKKRTPAKNKATAGKVGKTTPTIFDADDDILIHLSPSDEARQEEEQMGQTPPSTPTSLAMSRSRRTIKPKQFTDGTIRLIEKVPEVVRVQQSDGSLVYKLREDVESSAKVGFDDEATTSSKTTDCDNEEDKRVVEAKSTNTRILAENALVSSLNTEQETAAVDSIIDIRKLLCLKCKKQYANGFSLRRHAVNHLGSKRYKCKLCNSTSFNKSECVAHLRKAHGSEVATLLDAGLATYIIDLGLLSDNGEKLSLELIPSPPSSQIDGRTTPTSSKTLDTSKEVSSGMDDINTHSNSKPESLKSEVCVGDEAKKARSRRKKPPLHGDPPPVSSSSTKSDTFTAVNEFNDTHGDVSSGPKGRLMPRKRKQQMKTLSNSQLVTVTQDENNKRRAHRRRTVIINDESANADGPPPSKVARVYKVVEKAPDPVKQNEANSRLEGLLNKLRTVRKPLIGAEHNAKSEAGSIAKEAMAVTESSPDVTADGDTTVNRKL